MKLSQGKWLLIIGTVLALGTGITSMAASSVSIRFENGSSSTWGEGIVEPSVKVNGMTMEPEWNKDIDDWVPGKRVYATFVVDGEYKTSQCSVYGGELENVVPSDGESVIECSYIPVVKLAMPDNAGWSDTSKTKASWKKVPFAPQYQLRLYEDDQWIKTLTTKSTTIDLREYMKTGKQYYYEVRAITKEKSEEKYIKDGEFVVSDDSVVQQLGDTGGRWLMENGGRRYRNSAGNYMTSGWQMIEGYWYYFNEGGYAVTGWQTVGGKWYYMNGESRMLTGWQQLGGKWYFLNPDGSMAIGWMQTEPGKYYYLNGDGSMAVNTVVDGYNVNESGLWVQN